MNTDYKLQTGSSKEVLDENGNYAIEGNELDPIRDGGYYEDATLTWLEQWMATYGKVYKTLIDGGLCGIMGGHILMPAYMREVRPGIADDEIAHKIFHAETRMADAVALDPTHECFQIKTPFQRKNCGRISGILNYNTFGRNFNPSGAGWAF